MSETTAAYRAGTDPHAGTGTPTALGTSGGGRSLPAASGRPGPSLADLVQTASKDLSLLVHQEIELAKTEMTVAAKGAAKAASGLVVAAVLGLMALLVLTFTICEAFDTFLPRWLAFLITAVLYLLVAGVAAMFGLSALKKVKAPARTIATVKDDVAWAKHPTQTPVTSG